MFTFECSDISFSDYCNFIFPEPSQKRDIFRVSDLKELMRQFNMVEKEDYEVSYKVWNMRVTHLVIKTPIHKGATNKILVLNHFFNSDEFQFHDYYPSSGDKTKSIRRNINQLIINAISNDSISINAFRHIKPFLHKKLDEAYTNFIAEPSVFPLQLGKKINFYSSSQYDAPTSFFQHPFFQALRLFYNAECLKKKGYDLAAHDKLCKKYVEEGLIPYGYRRDDSYYTTNKPLINFSKISIDKVLLESTEPKKLKIPHPDKIRALFLAEHRKLFVQQQSVCFLGLFRNTSINESMTLKAIALHAMKGTNRSSHIFKQLGWMSTVNELTQSAPECIKMALTVK